MHAQMPCCAQTSFAPREAVSLQPAVFAGLFPPPQTLVPVVVVAQYGTADLHPSRVQATLTTASPALHEPTPPLFLLNAQFLI